jgi:hypothetical protein
MGSWKPDYSERRESLRQVPCHAGVAGSSSWVCARCPERERREDAAIPLMAAMGQFGSGVSSDRLRGALRCIACGLRGRAPVAALLGNVRRRPGVSAARPGFLRLAPSIGEGRAPKHRGGGSSDTGRRVTEERLSALDGANDSRDGNDSSVTRFPRRFNEVWG